MRDMILFTAILLVVLTVSQTRALAEGKHLRTIIAGVRP
jgi:hypothetical protein